MSNSIDKRQQSCANIRISFDPSNSRAELRDLAKFDDEFRGSLAKRNTEPARQRVPRDARSSKAPEGENDDLRQDER